VVRGNQSIRVECAPAFNYALDEHRTSLIPDDTIPANGEHGRNKQKKALFETSDLTLDLRFIAESLIDGVATPTVELSTLDLRPQGHKGISSSADLDLVEGQVVTFVLRTPPKATREHHIPIPTNDQAQRLGISYDRESHCSMDQILGCYTWPTRTVKGNYQPPQQRRSSTYEGIRHPFQPILGITHVFEEPSSRSATRHQRLLECLDPEVHL
jgi:hypothetical protein